ncbi:MAG: viroplasmin family protein [Candidatus Paceibacterota bacterium]
MKNSNGVNHESIIIFTDGASKGNPGPGGWGAVLIRQSANQNGDSGVVELGGAERVTTNNRMELSAAIHALFYLLTNTLNAKPCEKNSLGIFPQGGISQGRLINLKTYKLVLHSDSSYLINGITKWIFGWQKKNWITVQKEEVLNRDLWEKLFELTKNFDIEWKYVGGHSGVAGNERCDEIATRYAEQTRTERGTNPSTRTEFGTGHGAEEEIKLFNGKLSDYPIKNILSLNIDTEKTKIKNDSHSRSKAKAYSYLSMIGGKIEIHKTWAECENRVKGKSGARYKKSLSPIEEKEIISEWTKVRK